jgi:hypothetical protein
MRCRLPHELDFDQPGRRGFAADSLPFTTANPHLRFAHSRPRPSSSVLACEIRIVAVESKRPAVSDHPFAPDKRLSGRFVIFR